MTTSPYPPGILDFYYVGFLQVLRRYRTITILGWLLVLLGAVSIPLGWEFGGPHGLLDIGLSVAVVLAGLLVVHQAVMALESYISVPLRGRFAAGDTDHPMIDEIELVMKDVRDGGWWEARDAISRLHTIGQTFGVAKQEGPG